jgi:hypothetical protein
MEILICSGPGKMAQGQTLVSVAGVHTMRRGWEKRCSGLGVTGGRGGGERGTGLRKRVLTIFPDLSCQPVCALVKQGCHVVIQWVHVLHQPLVGLVVDLSGVGEGGRDLGAPLFSPKQSHSPWGSVRTGASTPPCVQTRNCTSPASIRP